MERTIGDDMKGGQIQTIFTVLRRAMGKVTEDNSKIAEVYIDDDKKAGAIASKPAEMRAAARDIGAKG